MSSVFEIEALKARLAELLRATFGRSSEKLQATRWSSSSWCSADHRRACWPKRPGPEPAGAIAAPTTGMPSQPGHAGLLPAALPRDVVEPVAPRAAPPAPA